MKHTLTTLIPTLLVAFACAASAQGQRFLSYEPEVVELDGQLVVQSKYGPPNFGEQPKTDQKVKVPVLVLRNGVSLLPSNGDGPNAQSAYNVRQIQLAFSSSETSHRALIGKPVVVKGTLFHAHTGHHYTDVVMNVESIERKPVGYDQREFAVCGIMTAHFTPGKGATSNHLETEFRALVGDEPTEKSIKLKNTTLTINAAIEYEYAFAQKGRPVEVRIGISVSEKEGYALYARDHVSAGTIYKRGWQLYVTKDVFVGETEHTLTLYCSDGNTKRK